MPPTSRIETDGNAGNMQRRRTSAAFLFQLLDSHRFIPACFVLFVVLRAALIFFVPVEISSDASWYLNRAISIANGEGYSEVGYPTAYWPVGYPGFLGALFYLFGQDQLVGQIANLLMAAGSFFLQLELTRRIFRSESTARLSILLLTIYPNHIDLYVFPVNRNLLYLFTASRRMPVYYPARLDLGSGVRLRLWIGNID